MNDDELQSFPAPWSFESLALCFKMVIVFYLLPFVDLCLFSTDHSAAR